MDQNPIEMIIIDLIFFQFQQTRYNKIAFKHGFSIVSCLLHPKSRGTISLRSRNPEDPPNIQPNYFSDPDDLRDLVIAADFAMRFGMSKPFEKHGVKVHRKV